jgi:ADP-heptose:LPS heptosyltransferase
MISYYHAKKIDRFLRSGIVASIFIGIRKIIKKFAKDAATKDIDTIYVVKLLGGGSLCILMPYLAELKSKKKIHLVLVSTRVCSIFSDEIGLFDQTINLDTKEGIKIFLCMIFRNFYNRIIGKHNSISINFEFHSAVTAYLSSLLFSPINCGVKNNFSITFAKIYEKSVFYNGHAQVADVYRRLIELAYSLVDLIPEVKSKSAIGQYIEKLEKNISIEQYSVVGDYIALSPFSSGLSPERELSYDQLCGAISKVNPNNSPIYILGSKADQIRANYLLNRFAIDYPNQLIYSLCGMLSIGASAKVARNANIFVTIDSGLNHYVRMTHARLIHSYWGPTDPKILLGDHFFLGNEVVHHKKIYCSPCVHIADRAPCNGRNICISGLFDHD